MSLEARIRELTVRHKRLDAEISDQIKRASSDAAHLAELKRRKLKLKDEIAQLRTN
ncbi:DUF465 domain-containing protein [bacterium]|nr:DUF465 domain-containing protein [bacterium]